MDEGKENKSRIHIILLEQLEEKKFYKEEFIAEIDLYGYLTGKVEE